MLVISRRTHVRAAVVAAAVLAAGVATATSASAQADLCFGRSATITDSVVDPHGINVYTGTPGSDVIIGTDEDDLIEGLGGNTSSAASTAWTTCAGDWATIRSTLATATTWSLATSPPKRVTSPVGRATTSSKAARATTCWWAITTPTTVRSTPDGSVNADGGNDIITDVSSTLGTVPPTPDGIVGDTLVGDHYAGELGDVTGKAGNDLLSSATAPIGGGNDFLSTGGGDEVQILAGPGNDYVDAGAGNDGIDGGPGRDFCNGGPGTDTAVACEAVINVP